MECPECPNLSAARSVAFLVFVISALITGCEDQPQGTLCRAVTLQPLAGDALARAAALTGTTPVKVVGHSSNSSGGQRPVVWTISGGDAANASLLPLPEGYTQGAAVDVNDTGQILGATLSGSGKPRGVLWKDGQAALLHPNLSEAVDLEVTPEAINDEGLVVGRLRGKLAALNLLDAVSPSITTGDQYLEFGFVHFPAGTLGPEPRTKIVEEALALTDVTSGTVEATSLAWTSDPGIGTLEPAVVTEVYVFQASDTPPGPTVALGMAAGPDPESIRAVGYTKGQQQKAFLWKVQRGVNGLFDTFIPLSWPSRKVKAGHAVNSAGVVVGTASVSGSPFAFGFSETAGYADLNDEAGGSCEMSLTSANDINDSGDVVGDGHTGGVSVGFFLPRAEEPQEVPIEIEFGKSAQAFVETGDLLTYTFEIANFTQSALSLRLRDEIPAGTVFSPAEQDFAWTQDGNEVVLANVLVPAAGVQTRTLRVRVTADWGDLPGNLIENAHYRAEVTGHPAVLGIDPVKTQIRRPPRPSVTLRVDPEGCGDIPAGTPLQLTAEVSPGDAPVDEVEFFIGSTSLGVDSTGISPIPPFDVGVFTFEQTWTAPAGIHCFIAKATDQQGTSGSSRWKCVSVGLSQGSKTVFQIVELKSAAGNIIPRAMNESGIIVGHERTLPAPQTFSNRPARWASGSVSILSGRSGTALAISDQGVISGVFKDGDSSISKHPSFGASGCLATVGGCVHIGDPSVPCPAATAFLYRDNTLSELQMLNSKTYAEFVTKDGDAIVRILASPLDYFRRWDGAAISDDLPNMHIRATNHHSDMVGGSSLVWLSAVGGDPLNLSSIVDAQFNDINGTGLVVGARSGVRAVAIQLGSSPANSTITDLGQDGEGSTAIAVNEGGIIVGEMVTQNCEVQSFVWDGCRRHLLTELVDGDFFFGDVSAINNDVKIAGTYTVTASGTRKGYLLVPIR